MLGAELFGQGKQFGPSLRVEDDLQNARTVTKVDEDQTTVVAAAVNPASYARLAANVGASQLTAPALAVPIGLWRAQ